MSRFARRCWAALCVVAMLMLGLQAGAASADPPDFSSPGEAFNILPPGQFGTLPTTVHSRDQLFMYDALTPLKDSVTNATLQHHLQEERVRARRTERDRVQTFPARPDLTVTRDSYYVPHIEAPTRDDVMYGIGFVTAEDRGQLMDTFRGPGRVAALDVPGLNPFQLAQSFQPFASSQETEDFLATQVDLILAGPARSADRRRHRQLPRGDQRFPHAGRCHRAGLEPQRRDRVRGADRGRVRQGRRGRGAPRPAPVRAEGPARRP